MKTDPGLRFDVELLNTGYDKGLLEKLLLRIKGLSLSPEIIVKSCPCIIATNISGSASKKLRQYLGQIGANVAIRSHTNSSHSFPSDTGLQHVASQVASASVMGTVLRSKRTGSVSPEKFPSIGRLSSARQAVQQETQAVSDMASSRQMLATTSITLKRSVGELTRALEDKDWTIREHAIIELSAVPSDSILRHIIKALKDDVWHVRCTALEVLSKNGSDHAVREMSKCLRDNVWHVRYQAIEALRRLQSDKVTRALMFALDDENWQVRQRAVQALGDLRSNRALGGILACLRDDVWHVRESAAKALAKLRSEKSVKALISSLQDPNWRVRSMVLSALWQIGTERAVRALLDALHDEEWMVHWKAAYALGKIGTVNLLPVLTWMERDRNVLIREAARNVLRSFDIVAEPRRQPLLRLEYRSEDPYANMIYIPSGEFLMGDDAGPENARPAHSVFLEGFLIDVYEVTNYQYKQFDAEHRYPQGLEWYPVVNVTWEQASAYAEWIGKRLPTEAEWEKAARGPEGNVYPWGPEFDIALCNTQEAGMRTLTSVNHYSDGRSSFGVYDLFGNVLEWTADQYQPYPGSLDDSPDYQEQFIVLRGASWIHPGQHYSCATRLYAPPENRSNFIGFRCVCDLKEPTGRN